MPNRNDQDPPPKLDPAELYRRMVEQTDDRAIFLMGLDGRFATWNPGVGALLGYSEQDWVGQEGAMIFTPEDKATGEPARELNEAASKGKAADVRWHLKRDGSRIFVDGLLLGLRDDAGELVGFAKIMRDATERHLASEALRESEERYRNERERMLQVFGQAPVAICVLRGRDLVYELVNGPYQELFPRRTVLGLPIREVIPELNPEVMEALVGVLDKGEAFRANEFHATIDRDGDGIAEDCWFNLVYFPLIEANGLVSGIIVVATDVTPQVQSRQALERQWKVFDTTLSHVPDFCYVFDLECRFTYVNRSLLALWGISLSEAMGKRFAELNYPPELSVKLDNQILQVIHTRAPVRDETPFTGPDGTTRHYEYIFVPILGEEGRVAGVAGSTRDITDRQEAERALKWQASELARSNADLQQFAYVISHDLQEPLRTITSFSQLLTKQYGGKLDSVADEYLDFIVSGAARMKDLVQSLLTYSRVVNVEATPFTAVPLDGVLQWAMMNLHAVIQETKARITQGSMPTVTGDHVQLVQLFQNLISNAIKYKKAAQPPAIHISAESRGEEWLISVKDNGLGIHPEHSQRIFGVFTRLHGKEIPGTGIGLAICRRIVERHNGRIWVESAAGEGSTFYLTLPHGTDG